MRYGQITVSRLSRSAKKLISDGEWHPFHATPLAWYRIWQKRLVQRAYFDDEEEQAMFLPLLDALSPLQLATTQGFREELTVRQASDGLEVVVGMGYGAPPDVDTPGLASFIREGITFQQDNGLTVAHIPIEGLTTGALTALQVRIVDVRDAFQSAIASR